MYLFIHCSSWRWSANKRYVEDASIFTPRVLIHSMQYRVVQNIQSNMDSITKYPVYLYEYWDTTLCSLEIIHLVSGAIQRRYKYLRYLIQIQISRPLGILFTDFGLFEWKIAEAIVCLPKLKMNLSSFFHLMTSFVFQMDAANILNNCKQLNGCKNINFPQHHSIDKVSIHRKNRVIILVSRTGNQIKSSIFFFNFRESLRTICFHWRRTKSWN